jgi:two-component system, chemotaxis family, CheB/CheR fusion protein
MSTSESTREFELLLEYLKRNRGFDFTGYKRSSVMRRIQKRMQMVGIEPYSDYMDYLEVHPDEFSHLFNTILINVTAFFRDPPAWEHLAEELLPRLLAAKQPHDPIRVWSAGCASGEEAYTLAMVLAEALGTEGMRERVKIYATDADEEALTVARQASYGPREVQGIPPELLEKWFEKAAQRYLFHKELRRSVIFGRHDLIQDAPISRVDLLTCRNVLMYFNAETQARILNRFHFALQNGGFLFLGKAEMLLTHTNSFTPVDLKRRFFTKVVKANLRDRQQTIAQADHEGTVNHLVNHMRIREAAFDTGPVPQVGVDLNGSLTMVNEAARQAFNLTVRDLGRPLRDLELSYRPADLRSLIDQAYTERRPISLKEVEWPIPEGSPRFVDIQVLPLQDNAAVLLGAVMTFTDVTSVRRLQEAVQQSHRELETAYEELQSTNEELETTNEELQSTVEELETTNEELQSTNAEIETVNEELQSTNEELQTINEELRQRSDELNDVNSFLESILASMRGGVVVLDAEQRIQIWSDRAEELWGLRAEEVRGKQFMNLDIGLPVEQLRQPIRACLAGESPVEPVTLNATNRRGKTIVCRVACNPLVSATGDHRGVILLMEERSRLVPA